MNELKELSTAIKNLTTLLDTLDEVITEDQQQLLKSNLDGLIALYHSTYKRQLKAFISYLETDYIETADDDEAWRNFTETPYVISHGDKAVVIDNFAEVYDGLLGILKEHQQDLV